jgi:hypothetical protein
VRVAVKAPTVGVATGGVSLVAGLLVAAVVVAPQPVGPSSGPVADIPGEYPQLYRAAAAAFDLRADGWTYLAAVGKVECDHGRSVAIGCHRGEINPAGARGPAQFLSGTWARYGVDADGDGRRDVYDPADAIFGMANYLRASGALGDWRRALFAYNHASWYVDRVLGWARRYAEEDAADAFVAPAVDGAWLAALPDAPSIRCDSRIVGDIEALTRSYGVWATACFGGAPHATDGEHPLGLAVDLVPGDGDWARTARLARDFGWSPSCAAAGCSDTGPFRVVLYNGYPRHGDPAHSSTPHLHLSWEHAPAPPFTRAEWVRTLLAPAPAVSRPASRGAEGGVP